MFPKSLGKSPAGSLILEDCFGPQPVKHQCLRERERERVGRADPERRQGRAPNSPKYAAGLPQIDPVCALLLNLIGFPPVLYGYLTLGPSQTPQLVTHRA